MTAQAKPMTSFNDDDWYEFDAATGQIVRQHSSKSHPEWSTWSPPVPQPGRCIMRGMRAKHLNLLEQV